MQATASHTAGKQNTLRCIPTPPLCARTPLRHVPLLRLAPAARFSSRVLNQKHPWLIAHIVAVRERRALVSFLCAPLHHHYPTIMSTFPGPPGRLTAGVINTHPQETAPGAVGHPPLDARQWAPEGALQTGSFSKTGNRVSMESEMEWDHIEKFHRVSRVIFEARL